METLINETIDSVRAYLPRLRDTSESIAELLQGGDQHDGMQKLPNLIEGLDWVIAAINGIKKNGYKTEIEPASLNNFFIEMEEAIQNQDFILLADLLEYEIAPVLEEWLNNL